MEKCVLYNGNQKKRSKGTRHRKCGKLVKESIKKKELQGSSKHILKIYYISDILSFIRYLILFFISLFFNLQHDYF